MEEQEYINYPQTPWYEERQNWLYIAIGVVLIVVIIVGGIIFVKSRTKARQEAVVHQELVQETETALSGDLEECEGASDADLCNEDKIRLASARANSPDMCNKLEGDSYAECIVDVAVAGLELGTCDALEESGYCRDRVNFAQAKEDHDYDRCERVVDMELHDACQGQLISYALMEKDCRSTHLSDEECLVREINAKALADADESICDRLADLGDVSDCKEEVGFSDKDGDGLSLLEEVELGTDPNNSDSDADGLEDKYEVRLGTNPNNSDSDGDGYADGEEFNNGYNPLGEGTL